MTKKQQGVYQNLMEQAGELEKELEQERIKALRLEFLEKGWRFILSHLKCPSSAQLINCYTSDDDYEPIVRLNEEAEAGKEYIAFVFDAQNGFGAMIRKLYVVIYEDGEPYMAMNPDDPLGDCFINYRRIKY